MSELFYSTTNVTYTGFNYGSTQTTSFRIFQDRKIRAFVAANMAGNQIVSNHLPAARLKVKASTEYVFQPDCHRLIMDEVEGYVKAKSHFPEIPSAKK